jgi:hypothetical protein
MSSLNDMLKKIEYDGKLNQPLMYAAFCETAASLVNLVPQENKESYLVYLEGMSTPSALSFGDQLSKENADKLRNIKEGCNQALGMMQEAPTIEQGNVVTR